MDSFDSLRILYIVNRPASVIIDKMSSMDQSELNFFIIQLCNLQRNLENSLEKMFSILQELSQSSGNKNITTHCISQLKALLSHCTPSQSSMILRFCSDNYFCIDPEFLKDFLEYFNISYSEENMIYYVMYLLTCNMPRKAVNLMKEFDLTVTCN